MQSAVEDFCLGQTIFDSLKKYHDRVLLYIADDNEGVTYSEIFTQSIRTALMMKNKGINRNDIISTCTHNQKYSLLPIIASQYLGVKTANLDPGLSHLESVYLLQLLEPRLLFVSEDSLELMESCINKAGVKTELVVFGSSKKYAQFSEYLQPNKYEENFIPVKVKETETALIVYSSGTTGFPKGICLSHGSFKTDAANPNNFNSIPIVSMMFVTFYGISAYLNFFKAVTFGNAMVFCNIFDPLLTWKLIEEYEVFSIFLHPCMAVQCLREKPTNVDVSSVKYVVSGGSSVTKQLMEDLRNAFPNAKVFNVYAQTEFGGSLICFFNPNEDYDEQIKKPLSCGKITHNVQWKIVDLNSGEALGPNKEGELRVKSKYFMNGYYKMDSSAVYDCKGYLKTGDIAYYDEENCIYIVDRIKEMFKCKTWHVIPSIVEEVIKSHPAVKEAAVIGIPHEEDVNHPMAVVVLNDDYVNTNANDILNYVNERVSDYQQLRAGIKIVESIPKTVTQKIKRKELLKIMLENIK